MDKYELQALQLTMENNLEMLRQLQEQIETGKQPEPWVLERWAERFAQ